MPRSGAGSRPTTYAAQHNIKVTQAASKYWPKSTKVKRGESYYQVAQRMNVTPSELAAANRGVLRPRAGAVLNMPRRRMDKEIPGVTTPEPIPEQLKNTQVGRWLEAGRVITAGRRRAETGRQGAGTRPTGVEPTTQYPGYNVEAIQSQATTPMGQSLRGRFADAARYTAQALDQGILPNVFSQEMASYMGFTPQMLSDMRYTLQNGWWVQQEPVNNLPPLPEPGTIGGGGAATGGGGYYGGGGGYYGGGGGGGGGAGGTYMSQLALTGGRRAQPMSGRVYDPGDIGLIRWRGV